MNPITASYPAVRLNRTIDASPQRVYRAWLEPDLLRRWMAPGGAEVTQVDVDERVGGHYRIWLADSGTSIGGFECELLELVPDRRIVWRWGFVGPRRGDGPQYDSLLTVTFAEGDAGTTVLTLEHERLGELAAAMPPVAGSVGAGWEDVLGKLTGALGEDGR
jgi:uncharacterized protein YndB with AHSA1/START domain